MSEASRCTIREMDNIELYELGETFRTIQCPIVLDVFQRRNDLVLMWDMSYALA